MMAGVSAEVQKQDIFHTAIAVSGSQTHPPNSWRCVSGTEKETKGSASPDYVWSLVNGIPTLMSIFVYCALVMAIYTDSNNLYWRCAAVFLNTYALVVSIMAPVKTKDEKLLCLFVLIMDIIIIMKAENNSFNYIFFIFAALIIFIKKEFFCTVQTKTTSTDNDRNNTIYIV